MSGRTTLLSDRLVEVDRATVELRLPERSAELDGQPAFPGAEFRALAQRGLVGLRLPIEQGGQGLSMMEAGAVLRRLAFHSGTTFAKLSLQPEFCSVLAEHGSRDLVDRWFRPLLRGERLIGNHVTEPGAGSDAASLALTATPSGEGFILEGTKSEVAFAADADAAIVYARTAPPRRGAPGITAFLVAQDANGIERTVIPDLGERWMRRGTVVYRGVHVPGTDQVGALGAAFGYLKDELTRERALLASIYLGVARASWEATVRHVGSRTVFDRPLAGQQAVAFPLVEDGTRLDAAELFVNRVLADLDGGRFEPGPAAMAKWLATDTALNAIDHAIQFHGGRGYSKALPHEQRWRDVRSGAIAHGPSEIMHLVAARDLWPGGGRPRPSTS